MVRESKFHAQLHAVLIDGIAFGGFNVVDLPALAAALELPCIAVMRKPPNLERVRRALEHLTRPASRWATIERAGPIHQRDPFVFQVAGCSPATAERALIAATDRGHVPEALRLAHLIGAAVATGESSNRA